MRALIFKDIMLSLKKDFFIPASYTDANAELTLFGALTLIQDIAAEHAEKMGIGFHDLKEKSGGFWVIAKTKLQFLRTPKLYEDIVLETWPQKPAGIVSTRNYLVTSKGGEPLFCAKNDWVIIDAATHKLMRLTDTCYPKEAEYIDKSALPERYIKMDYIPSSADYRYTHRVRFSDTDHVGHTNNIAYSKILLDALPVSYFKENRITDFDIKYIHESKEGDDLCVYVKQTLESVFLHISTPDGTPIVSAVMKAVKR